jgi:hypothetical protein
MRRGSKRGGSTDLDTARARGDLRCDLKRRCRRRAQGPDGAVVVDTGQVARWRTGSCCVEGAMQRRGRREVRMRRSGRVLGRCERQAAASRVQRDGSRAEQVEAAATTAATAATAIAAQSIAVGMLGGRHYSQAPTVSETRPDDCSGRVVAGARDGERADTGTGG